MKKRFDYYFMERNGLWSERLAEYEEKGGEASSIAILIHACEIGDGIDQHASEHLKAVSAYIAAQTEELEAAQRERDELMKRIAKYAEVTK